MGTSDLTKDLHALHTPMRLPMLSSLSFCLLAARAYGLAILDGVYLDLKDEAGFRAACRQGLELGFDGKTLIHPTQVEPCNEIFAPSAAEVEQARLELGRARSVHAPPRDLVRLLEQLRPARRALLGTRVGGHEDEFMDLLA